MELKFGPDTHHMVEKTQVAFSNIWLFFKMAAIFSLKMAKLS